MTFFFQVLDTFGPGLCTYAKGTHSRLLWGGQVLGIPSQTSTTSTTEAKCFLALAIVAPSPSKEGC